MLDSRFRDFENFVFDLDGTVWNWVEPLPGAVDVFARLRSLGKNVVFLTNNTMLTREGFATKLQNFGINASPDEIINPSLVACELFRGKTVFCIGEGIVSELRRSGARISPSGAKIVLVATDRSVTYEKLSIACECVFSGAEFYKTADGGIFIHGQRKLPGAGALANLVEYVTGKKAVLLGKPSEYMIEAVSGLELEPSRTVLFGDECDSDIHLGKKLGFTTVLVKTGRDRKPCGEYEPDYILNSIADITG
ncbi:MAG: HAD-IIA family hydrolase [Candidatus Micrarchaeota archaeon]|nr:HAD-IIA family hydrolase [Candidatus Micrarchaeota archaeon]